MSNLYKVVGSHNIEAFESDNLIHRRSHGKYLELYSKKYPLGNIDLSIVQVSQCFGNNSSEIDAYKKKMEWRALMH